MSALLLSRAAEETEPTVPLVAVLSAGIVSLARPRAKALHVLQRQAPPLGASWRSFGAAAPGQIECVALQQLLRGPAVA